MESNMNTKSWSLDDVELRNLIYPHTFPIPSKSEINDLEVGDTVKLIFQFNDIGIGITAERMWVQLTHILPEGGFKGFLDNNPVLIKDLKYRDKVEFKSSNIIDILE